MTREEITINTSVLADNEVAHTKNCAAKEVERSNRNMTVADFNKIKHLNYRDYCANRQNKNGKPSVSYGANGYTKAGYECHHIAEDIESNLSSTEKIKNLPHLQTPDQLVYLTLEEHLWAHLLISSEVLLKDSTSERCEELSKGGISAIINFNKNSLDNKLISAMIAEYCNRISSQVVLDVNNAAEAFDKFRSLFGITDIELIKEVTKHLRNTTCLPHNRQAYVETEAILLTAQSVITSICTCGGKTPFAIEYMLQHKEAGKKFIVVTPNTNIHDDWEERSKDYSDLFDVWTIQSLSSDKAWEDKNKIDWKKVTAIIIDEVHHINDNAIIWRLPIKYVVENFKSVKILGLTATVKDSQTASKDEIFGGRVVEGLDIVEGIQSGILWPYNYISSLYSADGFPVGEYNLLQEKLDLFLKDHNVAGTINKYEAQLNRQGQKKGIIFIAGTRNIPEAERTSKFAQFNRAIELVKEAYPNAKFYILSSAQSAEVNDNNKKAFIGNTTDDVFLVSFGMVNEGAHYEGVNTLIMFRTTHSEIVFTQQLGRIMRLKERCPEDPKLTVFDFTNNALTLIDEIGTEEADRPDYSKFEKKVPEKRPEKYLAGKDVIVACEAADIVQYLLTLRVMKDAAREGKLFADAFDDIDITDINIDEVFEDDVYDTWKDIEIVSKGTTTINRGPKADKPEDEEEGTASTTKPEDNAEDEEKKPGKKATSKDKIKLTKQELLVYLTKLTFDRAVFDNAIDLVKGKVTIMDEELVRELCKTVRLRYTSFLKIITVAKLVKFWEMRIRKIYLEFNLQAQ